MDMPHKQIIFNAMKLKETNTTYYKWKKKYKGVP